MPQVQTADRIGRLLIQYPTIATLYGHYCDFKAPHRPRLDIRVQKADTDMMFLTARNIYRDGRMNANRDQDNARGCRTQSLYAVRKGGNIIAHITAGTFDEKNLVIKDIFTGLAPSIEIEYLLWVSKYDWFACPTEAEAQRDVIFGDYLESNMDVVVITQPKNLTWTQLVDKATKIKSVS